MSSDSPDTDALFENNKAKGRDKIEPATDAERDYLYDVLDWTVVSTAQNRGHKTMHIPSDLESSTRSDVGTECLVVGLKATDNHRRKPMNAWPLDRSWITYCRGCVQRWREDKTTLDYPEELDQ